VEVRFLDFYFFFLIFFNFLIFLKGKSTIIGLIERFYDPDSGDIQIGPSNLSLKALNSRWLHSQIALVSQEPVLFGGKFSFKNY
jgi:ABC-type transport system involved in Fe-S cluster assembly fused permease/ATPase subunit